MKQLYSFLWIGGGYNQVYATSKKDAIATANRLSPPLRILESSVILWSAEHENIYYKSISTD